MDLQETDEGTLRDGKGLTKIEPVLDHSIWCDESACGC